MPLKAKLKKAKIKAKLVAKKSKPSSLPSPRQFVPKPLEFFLGRKRYDDVRVWVQTIREMHMNDATPVFRGMSQRHFNTYIDTLDAIIAEEKLTRRCLCPCECPACGTFLSLDNRGICWACNTGNHQGSKPKSGRLAIQQMAKMSFDKDLMVHTKVDPKKDFPARRLRAVAKVARTR